MILIVKGLSAYVHMVTRLLIQRLLIMSLSYSQTSPFPTDVTTSAQKKKKKSHIPSINSNVIVVLLDGEMKCVCVSGGIFCHRSLPHSDQQAGQTVSHRFTRWPCAQQ